ncbi:MAG: sensor histidine kinase, partial [Candidatus Electrothrix sp. AR3]|nr:sensor histidine kinase [Candidatus Electrothrix sp. AR3]
MKPKSSLFAKILAWFFLNLLLLAAVLTLFFSVQPQLNLHHFFGQQGSDRLRAAGLLIAHDLEHAPKGEWVSILSRHAEIHGVNFILLLKNGIVYSPTNKNIPEPVKIRGRAVLQHRHPRGRRREASSQIQDTQLSPRESECLLPKKIIPKKNTSHQGYGRKSLLIMRTHNPLHYWFGIRIPVFLKSDQRVPGLLLAVSDSVTGNGFFFDPLPWMVVAATMILISVLLWIPLIRNITQPLGRMTKAAEEIARGNFTVSIHEPRADEIGRLARTINHMTARLSAFVRGQKRFLGDVSHELGSPVARIQFGLGILEQRLEGENRERVVEVLEDVDHMSTLIGELLAFSRAEINSEAIQLEKIKLLPVVQTAVKREGTSSAKIEVQIDLKIQVVASAELLTRAIANLLRNAVKYAGKVGPIIVSADMVGE